MSRRLTFTAIIPVRNATEEELAAAARASLPLQAGRRLADWFGDDPVDAESGWRSVAELDEAGHHQVDGLLVPQVHLHDPPPAIQVH
jgi:hypothetical protein